MKEILDGIEFETPYYIESGILSKKRIIGKYYNGKLLFYESNNGDKWCICESSNVQYYIDSKDKQDTLKEEFESKFEYFKKNIIQFL